MGRVCTGWKGRNGGKWNNYSSIIHKINFFKNKTIQDNSWHLLDGPAPGGDSVNSSVSWDKTLSWQNLEPGKGDL